MITCLVKFSFSASLCQTKARAFWFEEHAGGGFVSSLSIERTKPPRPKKTGPREAGYSVSEKQCVRDPFLFFKIFPIRGAAFAFFADLLFIFQPLFFRALCRLSGFAFGFGDKGLGN